MSQVIAPEELPKWVPGRLLLASEPAGWDGVSLRSYRYAPSDVYVPPLRDHMIVAYRDGLTPMNRRFENRWTHEDVVPGDVSLLTRAATSHWVWSKDIEVVHLYLTQDLISRTCAQVFDRDVKQVELLDILRTPDPVVHGTAMAIADEVAADNLGGRLYVEALATQLSIHLLRRYAAISLKTPRAADGLSPMQTRQVREYIEAHLHRNPSLDELAAVARVSASHFLRQFKLRFGCAPHAYVIRRRVDCARRLLATTALSLKEVAARSGFADQAHMTRLFRRFISTTPKAYQRSTNSRIVLS